MSSSRTVSSGVLSRFTLFTAILWVLAVVSVRAGASELFAEEGKKTDNWSFEEVEFLPVDEAFVLSAEVLQDGSVQVRWDIVDGYYLYRHRFGFDTRTSADEPRSTVVLGAAEIPPGKTKVDEYFGEVEVYYHQAQARVPTQSGSGLAEVAVEVGISYQGWS